MPAAIAVEPPVEAAPPHSGRSAAVCAAPVLRRADWVTATAFVVLAAALRLPRLGDTPGWDGDEGYNVNIAWHLWHGQAQYFALDYHFVQHPILFYALLAPLLGFFGPSLVVARALAAIAGALSAGVVYLAMTAGSNRRAAALAALPLAGAWFAVLYGRFAYTYNLLALWTAIALLGVVVWTRTGHRLWFWLAVAAAALGWLTDQEGIALSCFLAVTLWPRRRLALAAVVAASAPAVLFALGQLAVSPADTLADWSATFGRFGSATGAAGDVAASSGGAGLAAAGARWLVNYLHLLRSEWWVPLGVAGLFCLTPLALRRQVLALFGCLIVPIFALRELDPFFRTGVPLFIPLACGAGALLNRGLDAIFATAGGGHRAAASSPNTRRVRWLALLLAAGVVGLPLGLEIGRSAGALVAGFSPRFDWALIRDEDDARAAASYLNPRLRETDVIVVSPAVAWLYHGQTADFFQAVARDGDGIAFYPAGLSARRFRFDPAPAAASYAVLDPYADLWASQSGAVAALVRQIEAWPLEWRRGQTRIHHRP